MIAEFTEFVTAAARSKMDDDGVGEGQGIHPRDDSL